VEELAAAAVQIRESRLYLVDYKSWDEYCKQRWAKSKWSLNRAIKALVGSETAPAAPPIITDTAGRMAGQDAPPRDTSGSNLSNAEITEREPGDDPQEDAERAAIAGRKDPAGNPVPVQAVAAFDEAEKFSQLAKDIDAIRRKVNETKAGPAGALLQEEDVKMHLRNAKVGITSAKPTHVCPMCMGKQTDCRCCKGRGWTVEHVYDRITKEQNNGK
jgi:hypothetical protein